MKTSRLRCTSPRRRCRHRPVAGRSCATGNAAAACPPHRPPACLAKFSRRSGRVCLGPRHGDRPGFADDRPNDLPRRLAPTCPKTMAGCLRTACAARLLALLLLTLPAAVQAQFNYMINNGTITITGYTDSGGAVTIPSTINGLPVTSIGDGTFQSCSSLTSVAGRPPVKFKMRAVNETGDGPFGGSMQQSLTRKPTTS